METVIPEGYRTCSVTGYLESLSGQGIQPKHLTAFLKAFKRSGNKTKAIEAEGFTFTELEWHLQNDAIFKRDFRNTLLSMRHELESVMFGHAFKSGGHRALQTWMEINFPEDFKKGTLPKGKKEKSRLDGLLDDLT